MNIIFRMHVVKLIKRSCLFHFTVLCYSYRLKVKGFEFKLGDKVKIQAALRLVVEVISLTRR